jgi:NTE family protein
MEKQISQQVGETLDTPKLENDLLYIFGSGHYSNMGYQLLGNKDKTTLRVLPTKKPWGPNFGRAGINFGWGTNETAAYNLRLGYQMTQLNKLDGEVLVSGQIGSNNRAGINYYQPIEPRQRAFTELSANFDHQDTALFQNGQAQFEYETNATEINAGIGYNFSHYGIVKAGLLQRWQSANLSIGMDNLLPSKASSDTNGWYVLADFDQMNHLYFPTKGWSARARYFDDGSYSKLSGEAQRAFNFDKFVVTGRVAYVGSVKGQLPLVDAAFLGGPNNLSGLSNRQLIGDDMQYTGLRIERILGKMPLGLRGDLRLGLAAEAGYMGTRYSENQSSSWIKSGGLYLGGETPVGPFFLGVAKASGNKPRVYLFIGTP